MSRWNLGWLLGVSAVTLVGLSLSFSAPAFTGDLESKQKSVNLIIDVMEEVQHKYVKKLDDGQMRTFVEDMINGGLQQLDPHSAYINAEEFAQFQQQSTGKFGGIGIRITADRAGQILVESPLVGTPAYNAGVLAGDVIVKIDGVSTENMPMKEVIRRIQGDPGEKVTLTVVHEDAKEPVDIEITRDVIRIDSVWGDLPLADADRKWDYMIDKVNKVAYIRVASFSETTVAELTQVVEDLRRQGVQGLILDLRNNPGGLLRSAVEVSSMFLEPGKTVVSTKGRNQEEETYRAQPPRGFTPMLRQPIAILLNRYSASASEIVAAALKDWGRAVIVGERSYGKGSVQNVILMENGTSALKLTTASYWRPNGHNIHRFPDSKEEDEWGVKPDEGYEIEQGVEERIKYFQYRRERDILRQPGAEKKPAPGAKSEDKRGEGAKDEGPFVDRVLEKALEYIKGEIQKREATGAAPAGPGARLPAGRTPGASFSARAGLPEMTAGRRPQGWA